MMPQSWQIIFVCSEHTNTQVDGNRCWLFIYSFLHFSHLYKVDTQSFFINLKLLISDSPHQTRPGTRQEMIMKRNPAMSWSSLISCLWTSQRVQRWTPKGTQTFFCLMAQRFECILWNIDWCSTVSIQVIFDFDCCIFWRNLDLCLVEQLCCEASDWPILTFSSWQTQSEITISFSASFSLWVFLMFQEP